MDVDDLLKHENWTTVFTHSEFHRIWWYPYSNKVYVWQADRTDKPAEPPLYSFYGTKLGRLLYEALLWVAVKVSPALTPRVEAWLFNQQFDSNDVTTHVGRSDQEINMDCLFKQFEHVTEYGVHWNFFFTLGFLPCTYAIVKRIPPKNRLVTAIITAFAYELLLKNTGLMEWALTAPRTDLISQNKEGITSFMGYLAIFAFGNALGFQILNPKEKLFTTVIRCLSWAGVAHGIFYILRIATQPSRRLANLPYVFWCVSFNAGLVGVFALLEIYRQLWQSQGFIIQLRRSVYSTVPSWGPLDCSLYLSPEVELRSSKECMSTLARKTCSASLASPSGVLWNEMFGFRNEFWCTMFENSNCSI
ncbi:hypothetical protein FF38_02484 [Lucilia cuprina]|uniref:Uncharacterized protein n=1 Tax=Lucilia cuprina TaxID=7375 RepID=A0A0L0CBG7_LUCCU|nr:hypothetical protein FF38_02484 [Lucilia cuprina]